MIPVRVVSQMNVRLRFERNSDGGSKSKPINNSKGFKY